MTLAAAALRMPAAEREEFLRVACKNEATLYDEVAEVVEWEERMGDFLRQPLIELIDLESPPKPFQPGQLIADRFVIMAEAGEGGMGVVYDAFDRKRNQRVAIKCGKPGFGRLLSPELEGALKVRHPNICLVNEIHTAHTEAGEVDFLTMEFLEGETLAQRLARAGKLNSAEALEIARQLCAGLAAAHQAGILHRDLKAGNVILVKDDDGSTRAVITDFGLAAPARLESEMEGGTPRYVAPELWRGENPSAASDVYALGVVLHEMVTGQPPSFEHAGVKRDAALKLPSTINHELDARWDKAILPCLAVSAAERPQAQQVLSVFDRRPLWKSPVAAAGVLALMVVLAAFQQPIMKLFKPADIRLAILPVEAPANLQEIGNGVLQDVMERIRRSQRGGATVVLIPASDSLRNGVLAPAQARQVLHATHALQLKLFVQGKDVAATEEIIELAHDTRLREFSGEYSDGTMGELPAALAGTVSLALHLQRNPSEQISSTATPFYDRGLYFVRSDKYSYDDAIPLLEQAAKLDPHSPLPFAALVEAEVGKFGLTKDKSHLEAARQRLSQAEALNPDSVTVRLAAGMLNEATGQSEKALQDYRRVQELEPRNVEASLRIGQIYDSLNMYDEALESYRKAIDLEPGYYEGYEWLGTFYYYRGKLAEAADAFQQAIERAPGRYGAYMNLGAVLDVLGRDEEAIASLKKSLAIKKTARALNSLGAVLAYQQRDRDAVEYYRQAVEMEPGNYKYFMNLADSQRRLGQAEEARQAYKEGKKLVLAELQQNPHLGPTRAYLAYFKTRLGDRDGAEEEMAEALQVSPNDTQVIRSAILSYDALGLKEKAFAIAHSAPADLLNELRRHPDLAEFSGDPRFLELLAKK